MINWPTLLGLNSEALHIQNTMRIFEELLKTDALFFFSFCIQVHGWNDRLQTVENQLHISNHRQRNVDDTHMILDQNKHQLLHDKKCRKTQLTHTQAHALSTNHSRQQENHKVMSEISSHSCPVQAHARIAILHPGIVWNTRNSITCSRQDKDSVDDEASIERHQMHVCW